MIQIQNITWQKVEIARQMVLKTNIATQPPILNLQLNLKSGDKIGIGHTAPNTITGENADQILASFQEIKDFLVDKKFPSIGTLLETVKSSLNLKPASLHALDLALLDLLAKQKKWKLQDIIASEYRPEKFQLSFWQNLKYKFSSFQNPYFSYQIDLKNLTDLTTYTIGIASEIEIMEELEQKIEQGFYKFKIKIGQDIKRDKDILVKIRQKVGKKVFLIADANQGYSLSHSLEILPILKKENYKILEQPTAANNLADLKTIQENTEIPIYADETAKDLISIKKIIENKICDGIVIKLIKFGGIYETVKVLNTCLEAGYTNLILSCYSESSLSLSAAYQLVKVFPEVKILDLDSVLMTKKDPFGIIDKSFYTK
jgi:L-alanine-DL-glutamate epimerase-like enolase superfamily enzyme